MTLETIKAEIERLPEGDRRDLLDWLEQLQYAEWDVQIERDFAPGGRAAFLLQEAQADEAAGHTKPIEDLFRKDQ